MFAPASSTTTATDTHASADRESSLEPEEEMLAPTPSTTATKPHATANLATATSLEGWTRSPDRCPGRSWTKTHPWSPKKTCLAARVVPPPSPPARTPPPTVPPPRPWKDGRDRLTGVQAVRRTKTILGPRRDLLGSPRCAVPTERWTHPFERLLFVFRRIRFHSFGRVVMR